MLAEQKATWLCKNPRCYKEISFGDYCPECKKLAIRRKIPNTIICETCGKEVVIKRQQKKRFCNECAIINNNERSLDNYYIKKEYKLVTG